MSMTFDQKVINAFELAGAALVKYEKQAQALEEEKKAAAALIPSVVEKLVRFGRIELHEKEACARALANPLQALTLMEQLAMHKTAAEQTEMGTLVDAQGRPSGQRKQASAYAGGGYVGRRSGDDSEAWQRMQTAVMGG